MPTLAELARTRCRLAPGDEGHLHRLAASWRMLSDLCFADLLLMAPVAGEEGGRFVVLAQVRPTTGQTLYPADMVGTVVNEEDRDLVGRAWRLGESVEGLETVLGSTEKTRIECTPVRHRGRPIAVMTRESATTSGRRPGELERYYLETYERLARMVAQGTFPFRHEEVEFEDAPRVGDGVLVLDASRVISFTSPNAVSALHRMGIHAYAPGLRLPELGLDESAVQASLAEQHPVTEEVERGNASVVMRVVPLLDEQVPVGAVLLVRDVTDLRRRDRMLLSKDATIREIHHRVKNNLQTIASLLRLQARRMRSTEGRQAMEESERRIRSIAIVHETLSREAGDEVPFGEIVRPLVRLVEDTVSGLGRHLHFDVEGDPGDLPAEVATPLAVVLNELLQNAVDHAYPEGDGPEGEGHVQVSLRREGSELVVEVTDDGVGLPEDFALETEAGLGLSIVRALVTGELRGSIEMREDGGTRVHVRVPVSSDPLVEL